MLKGKQMKRFGFLNTLGFVTGVLFMVLGGVLIIGGPLTAAFLDSMLLESARGLYSASSAIRTATDGVSNSTGMVEEVRLSLERTSEAVLSTAVVLQQTVSILNEMETILPALAKDMESVPAIVRNLMPANSFDDIAQRTNIVSTELGFLNTQLEALAGDVTQVGEAIGDVTGSVEAMEEDLLSAQGSFGDAADKMDMAAASMKRGSYTGIIVASSIGLGILLLLSGLYQISSGMMIRKLAKGQVTK